MKCPNCGGQLDITDKRCPYCNAINDKYKKPIIKPTQEEVHKQQLVAVRKLKIKFLLKLLGASVFAAVGIIVISIILAKIL